MRSPAQFGIVMSCFSFATSFIEVPFPVLQLFKATRQMLLLQGLKASRGSHKQDCLFMCLNIEEWDVEVFLYGQATCSYGGLIFCHASSGKLCRLPCGSNKGRRACDLSCHCVLSCCGCISVADIAMGPSVKYTGTGPSQYECRTSPGQVLLPLFSFSGGSKVCRSLS